jgi:hypothetical protein
LLGIPGSLIPLDAKKLERLRYLGVDYFMTDEICLANASKCPSRHAHENSDLRTKSEPKEVVVARAVETNNLGWTLA